MRSVRHLEEQLASLTDTVNQEFRENGGLGETILGSQLTGNTIRKLVDAAKKSERKYILGLLTELRLDKVVTDRMLRYAKSVSSVVDVIELEAMKELFSEVRKHIEHRVTHDNYLEGMKHSYRIIIMEPGVLASLDGRLELHP